MELPKRRYFFSNETDPYEEKLRTISNTRTCPERSETIAFIIPPSTQHPTPGREFLITGPFEGFTYITTLTKKMGFRLRLLDCRLKDNPEDYALNNTKSADLIAISSFCDSFIFLESITRQLKDREPEIPILLGGPLVTSIPHIILQNTTADAAIIGEGELTLIEFLERYFEHKKREFEGIKGLAFKRGGKVFFNPERPQIRNLDNLPLLDYTIWPDFESIVKNGQILISSTRGCPHDCSFCFKTIPQLRIKSISRFENEVAYLKEKTNFSYTWLNDLNININEKRTFDVTNIMKRYGIRYHCFARVRPTSKGLMDHLSKTGCLGIWFGIESYDQNILDANRKETTIDEINRAVQIASETDIAVRGLFIVGLYGETESSLRAMIAFIQKNTFLPLVKYLVPFPGTSIYYHALKTGKIKDPVEFLRMLSKRQIRDNDDEIINITDLPDSILREYFQKIWAITKEREKQPQYCL